LLLTVSDLMHTGDQIPLVRLNAPFKELLLEMTRKRLGTAGVTDEDGRLAGIFTDGDLRRRMEQQGDLFAFTAAEVMTPKPKTIAESELVVTAVARMEDYKITTLFVVDDDNYPRGILHLHDILASGAV